MRSAKNLEYLCEKEMHDIEMCSECFDRSNTMDEWFTEVCDPPHLLVWARMKKYPFWPAKVFGFGVVSNKKIDVRFFGKHTRANVPISDCFLYSDDPNEEPNSEELAASIMVSKVYNL